MKFVIIDVSDLNRVFVLERDNQLYLVNKYLEFTLGKKIGDVVIVHKNSDYYDYIVPHAAKQTFRGEKFRYDLI